LKIFFFLQCIGLVIHCISAVAGKIILHHVRRNVLNEMLGVLVFHFWDKPQCWRHDISSDVLASSLIYDTQAVDALNH